MKVNHCNGIFSHNSSTLTGSFQPKSDGGGVLPIFPTQRLLLGDLLGLLVDHVQAVTQDLVETKQQVPVVVHEEQRVQVIL